MRQTSCIRPFAAFAPDHMAAGSGEAELSDVGPGALRVGLSSADITPEGPVYLAGFGGRREYSRGVHRSLTATCVVFDNGVTRTAFLALDLLQIRENHLLDLHEEAEKAGIPAQNLMVNCSHTHYGPDFRREGNDAYQELFPERTYPLLQAAVDDLRPAVLDYTVGSCTLGVNRRQMGPDGEIGFRPEPRKPIDLDVPILRALEPDGTVRCVIFGHSCHPTTVGQDEWYLVSTDYPGYARDWIAAAYPGCTPVFLQGCGADVKPRYTRPHESGYGRFNYVLLGALDTVAEVGHELGRAVMAALMVPPPPVPAEASPSLKERLDTPIELGGIVEKVETPQRDPEKEPNRIYMGAWRVGDVYFFGSQCEVGTQVGMRIKRELEGTRMWANGYTHWGGGYLIDAASYPEGGYEINASAHGPATEDIVVSTAVRYVNALGSGKTGMGPVVEA